MRSVAVENPQKSAWKLTELLGVPPFFEVGYLLLLPAVVLCVFQPKVGNLRQYFMSDKWQALELRPLVAVNACV